MTSLRLSSPPRAYQRPASLRVHALASLRTILPRLRCGVCDARLWVDPPSGCSPAYARCLCEPGRLYCPDCARDYGVVVDRLPKRVPNAGGDEDDRPRRGRRPTRCADCGEQPPAFERRVCEPCRYRRDQQQRRAP